MSRLGFFGACACLSASGRRRRVHAADPQDDKVARSRPGGQAAQGDFSEICALLHHHKPKIGALFSRKGLDARLTEDEVAAFMRELEPGLSAELAAAAAAQLVEYADTDGDSRLSLKEIIDATAVAKDDEKVRKEFWDAMRKCAKLCFVHLPVLSVVCSVVFGGMLALVEEWSYEDAFFLVLAEITSTDIKIIEPVEPKGTFGKIVGCLVGLLSLAVFGGIAGIFSGPLLDPILARTRLRPTDDELNIESNEDQAFLDELCYRSEHEEAKGLAPRVEKMPWYARDTFGDGGVSVGWLCRKLVQHRAGVRGMFDELDMDGNGSLSRDELGEGLVRLGPRLGIPPLSQAKVFALFAAIDVDGDGALTHEEVVVRCREVAEADRQRIQMRDAMLKLGALVLVGLPTLALVLSLVFGTLLAVTEGWGWENCFYLVLTNLTGTSLTVVKHVQHAEALHAKLVACAVGLFSITIFAIVIGVLGGPLIEPLAEIVDLAPLKDPTIIPAEYDTERTSAERGSREFSPVPAHAETNVSEVVPHEVPHDGLEVVPI